MRRSPPLAALLLVLACAAPPPPSPAPEPARPFDAERAWRDLEALAAIGSRPSGSEGAARARDLLRSRLEAVDLGVRTWRPGSGAGPESPPDAAAQEATGSSGTGADGSPAAGASAVPEASVEEALAGEAAGAEEPGAAEAAPEIVHLAGVIPGELDDLVVLAARYDSAPGAGPAANSAASGPALLLELARSLAADPLPYTTWVVFLDGGPDGREGVRAWAESLQEEGLLDRVRVALFFRRVADGQAPIVRDLLSRRPYREIFWEAAAQWGAREAFPAELDFAPADTAHTALLEAGLRRVVAIAGEAPAASASPAPSEEIGEATGDAEDARVASEEGAPAPEGTALASQGASPAPAEDAVARASRQRLGTVGLITLEGLDVLTRRLAKVDRLLPASGPDAGPAEPEPAPAARAAPGGGA